MIYGQVGIVSLNFMFIWFLLPSIAQKFFLMKYSKTWKLFFGMSAKVLKPN